MDDRDPDPVPVRVKLSCRYTRVQS
eukprot:SAG31_NODE_22372_length_527_cov_0.817757_2_plen_24_part_01